MAGISDVRTTPISRRAADLKNFPITGSLVVLLGMTRDDSPLVLRDTGTQEIYSLDWQAP